MFKNLPIYISVSCANISNGEIGFCNCHSCSEYEGDCDYHHECQEGLKCGFQSCPSTLYFDSFVDCCINSGHENYCTAIDPCGVDEGDCDSHDECQSGLGCGSNNCPISLGI